MRGLSGIEEVDDVSKPQTFFVAMSVNASVCYDVLLPAREGWGLEGGRRETRLSVYLSGMYVDRVCTRGASSPP